MKLAEGGWKEQIKKECVDNLKKKAKTQGPAPGAENMFEEILQQARGKATVVAISLTRDCLL